MENHHFHGKTHYKWPFSIAMLNYQRYIYIHAVYYHSIPHEKLMSLEVQGLKV